jgi:hypothetical protein
VGTHLKRQVGVEDATYKAGTIDLTADKTRRAFEIGALLRTLQEIGITPIKRIDAVVPGRVMRKAGGYEIQVLGTGERLLIKGTDVPEGEQVLKGIIEVGSNGVLVLKSGSRP